MKPIYMIAASSILAFTLMSINLTQAEENDATGKATSPATASALKVVVDKETGELRSATAEEAAAMQVETLKSQKQTMQDNTALSNMAGKMQHHANGMKSMVLDPSMMESLSASVKGEGSLTLGHGDHALENKSLELPEQ